VVLLETGWPVRKTLSPTLGPLASRGPCLLDQALASSSLSPIRDSEKANNQPYLPSESLQPAKWLTETSFQRAPEDRVTEGNPAGIELATTLVLYTPLAVLNSVLRVIVTAPIT
jgi:hypothetical protein